MSQKSKPKQTKRTNISTNKTKIKILMSDKMDKSLFFSFLFSVRGPPTEASGTGRTGEPVF